MIKKLVSLVVFLAAAAHGAAAQEKCEDTLERVITKADIIAAGNVSRLAQPSGMWSGFVMISQYVDYTDGKVYKGTLSRSNFSVGYLVVEGGELSDKEKPGLSPEIFKVGVRQLVFIRKAKKGDYRYGTMPPYPAALKFTADESLCVLKADEATIEKVKEAVQSSKASHPRSKRRRSTMPQRSRTRGAA